MKKHLIRLTILSLTLLTVTPLLARSLAQPIEELPPLHQAVANNDTSLVTKLLSTNPDVNQKSQLRHHSGRIVLNKTPLHLVKSEDIAKLGM